jgi:pimeloyl-ACP methyl ester carboxylesterase
MSRLASGTSATPTLVLVHGAGHTADVWSAVQDHLQHPSLAIDLPGRRDRDGDLPDVTIARAAESVERDVAAVVDGPVVLVGHSAGGVVLPATAARLDGSVRRLVFVAGLCAREGRTAMEIFDQAHEQSVHGRLARMRARYQGYRFMPAGAERGERVIHDPGVAMSIDSLNYITQPISWMGVAPDLPRSFIRCLGDAMQSRAIQARLADACGASETIDIDAGHNVAIEAPARLAAILDRLAKRAAS